MNLERFGFIPPMKLGFVTVFQTSLLDSRSLFKQTNEIRHMLSDAVCAARALRPPLGSASVSDQN